MREVTVKIWNGYSDRLPAREPDHRHDLELYEDGDYAKRAPRQPPHDADTWLWAEDIAFHSGPVEIHLDTDEPAWLFVHTNDSYHNPDDWGIPVERGLRYGPDVRSSNPFGCEVWGRVVLWAARREA